MEFVIYKRIIYKRSGYCRENFAFRHIQNVGSSCARIKSNAGLQDLLTPTGHQPELPQQFLDTSLHVPPSTIIPKTFETNSSFHGK